MYVLQKKTRGLWLETRLVREVFFVQGGNVSVMRVTRVTTLTIYFMATESLFKYRVTFERFCTLFFPLSCAVTKRL